jgi:hypothetical protein
MHTCYMNLMASWSALLPAAVPACLRVLQFVTRMFATELHGNVLVPLMAFSNHVSVFLDIWGWGLPSVCVCGDGWLWGRGRGRGRGAAAWQRECQSQV